MVIDFDPVGSFHDRTQRGQVRLRSTEQLGRRMQFVAQRPDCCCIGEA
jgi:hypothetical protein